MRNKKKIISDIHENTIFADGFDQAIVGYERNSGRVIYDISKMIKILEKKHNMDYWDSLDYIEFNVLNAYVGEFTPIYIFKI